MTRSRAIACGLVSFGFVAIAAQDHMKPPPKGGDAMPITVHRLADITWSDGPPSLPAGAKVAFLEGDPNRAGPFVFRIKLPDAYRVPPHTHPKVERITVLQGQLNIGMGEKFDEKATQPMPAGTYGYWPAGMTHFAWMKGETILQVHGDGPWTIKYVNPEDDPRNAKKQ